MSLAFYETRVDNPGQPEDFRLVQVDLDIPS